MNDPIAVEMESLLRASRRHLPEAISKYNKAVAGLDELDGHLDGAFKRTREMFVLRVRLAELRDVMRERLERTSVSLDDTAVALGEVVVSFTAQDKVLADEIFAIAARNGWQP